MTPRIHHTVQPDVRLPFNQWSEYIYEERFKMLFDNLREKLKNQKNK